MEFLQTSPVAILISVSDSVDAWLPLHKYSISQSQSKAWHTWFSTFTNNVRQRPMIAEFLCFRLAIISHSLIRIFKGNI